MFKAWQKILTAAGVWSGDYKLYPHKICITDRYKDTYCLCAALVASSHLPWLLYNRPSHNYSYLHYPVLYWCHSYLWLKLKKQGNTLQCLHQQKDHWALKRLLAEMQLHCHLWDWHSHEFIHKYRETSLLLLTIMPLQKLWLPSVVTFAYVLSLVQS